MTTVLLVDDDPLQAYVRTALLKSRFSNVERAADVAEAFILVEEREFAERLGLVVVGLNRPGLGSPAFVAELICRLPSVPILVLGNDHDRAAFYAGPNVRFLPPSVPSDQMLAESRHLIEHCRARVA